MLALESVPVQARACLVSKALPPFSWPDHPHSYPTRHSNLYTAAVYTVVGLAIDVLPHSDVRSVTDMLQGSLIGPTAQAYLAANTLSLSCRRERNTPTLVARLSSALTGQHTTGRPHSRSLAVSQSHHAEEQLRLESLSFFMHPLPTATVNLNASRKVRAAGNALRAKSEVDI